MPTTARATARSRPKTAGSGSRSGSRNTAWPEPGLADRGGGDPAPSTSLSALDRLQITIRRPLDDLLGPGGDDPLASGEERPVEPVVGERRQAFDDVADRLRVQGNVVGITIHERDLLRVHADLRLVARHERPSPLRALGPVEDLVAREVAAGADEREAVAEFERPPFPEADGRVGPHHPGPLGLVDVDGGVAEGPAPLDHRRVIVRVR